MLSLPSQTFEFSTLQRNICPKKFPKPFYPCTTFLCQNVTFLVTKPKRIIGQSLTHQKLSSAGLVICSSIFCSNCSIFTQKGRNEQFAQKNEQFVHSLIFGEWPEQIAHGHWCLVRDLRDLLTSLIFGERPVLFAHIAHKKGNEWIPHFFYI